uniref:HTH OST-type domain-containing protein n=1 Tax=Anopheles melas TaxID=34690 RepID=A0A182UJ84_9DIPT
MKELKAILRSLVISNAERGMSESQLDRDFKSLEGRNIPYREHGFQSLDAMLRTMTDVVKVMGIGTGATVYPVTSEKTQHILEMVEKSKKNKKKKPKYTAPYVRKTASNPLPKPKPVVAAKSNSYGKNNNYNYYNNNYQHNGTGRAANAGQKRPATASSSKKMRENLTITIPNDLNEQFNMFWNAIQPVLNTSYGQNTRQQYQQQQSWGNQYGYYQNAQQYQNNCNGNQQRYANNQKPGRKGQNEWSNKRAFYGNGNDFTSDCWNSYYSQFYGNEHFGGNFFTGGGCYPSLQNYYSSYGYGNFQTNMYTDGAWECNYNASYGYDQYGYFLQGMGNNYY